MPSPTHLIRAIAVAATLGLAFLSPSARADDGSDVKLQQLVAGPQRTASMAARDIFRHPYEVLHFFGVKDDMVVVEIWPGGAGFWTEILAPYLHDHGQYYAALDEAANASQEALKSNAAFAAKMAANPAIYDRVKTTEFAADRHDIAPPGSADMVVTFRNVHNWMASHEDAAAFATFFKALKPGGILGLEEHRGLTSIPQDPEAKSGYVRQDYAIALAEKAGFKFVGSSEVNANPKDTKDYASGVWTLPPVFRLGQVDRAKYEAIGESDRMVLKFVKPKE
jgi:predicted methyltransferase